MRPCSWWCAAIGRNGYFTERKETSLGLGVPVRVNLIYIYIFNYIHIYIYMYDTLAIYLSIYIYIRHAALLMVVRRHRAKRVFHCKQI